MSSGLKSDAAIADMTAAYESIASNSEGPFIASVDNDCTKDRDVFAQAKLHFRAVAQMIGSGLGN